MITISQCSDSKEWEVVDRLTFQIWNGKSTTYVRSNTPNTARVLSNKDMNTYNDMYSFYYKEQE